MDLRRLFRYHWLKFLRLQEGPRKIAGGMALGVLIAFTPTIPFNMIGALTLAALPITRVSSAEQNGQRMGKAAIRC